MFGIAVVRGTAGTVSHAGLTSTSDTKINRSSVANEAEVSYLKDGANQTISMAVEDPQKVVTLDFTPVAKTTNTAANAKTAIDDWDLAIGSVVTLAAQPVDWMNGDYNLVSVGASFEKNGFATVALTLRQFNGNELAAIS